MLNRLSATLPNPGPRLTLANRDEGLLFICSHPFKDKFSALAGSERIRCEVVDPNSANVRPRSWHVQQGKILIYAPSANTRS